MFGEARVVGSGGGCVSCVDAAVTAVTAVAATAVVVVLNLIRGGSPKRSGKGDEHTGDVCLGGGSRLLGAETSA